MCIYGKEKQNVQRVETAAHAINVKGRIYGLVCWEEGLLGEEMPRIEHLIWDEKQLALGLLNPQCSSPSTLMNKECTVCAGN